MDELLTVIKETAGASNCAVAAVADFVLDEGLRQNCEMNYCGEYGRTWVCPPHCGDIKACIAKVKKYDTAIVIQTIDPLEDSYDFEGMEAAGRHFHQVFEKAAQLIEASLGLRDMLCLSAGSCHICPVCALAEDKPCRFPKRAYPSLESHGIFVSDLAEKAGLKYINGKDTVTYFGAVLYNK